MCLLSCTVCIHHRLLSVPYCASATHRSFISSSGCLRSRRRGDSSRLQKGFDDFASTLSMCATARNRRSTSICTTAMLSVLIVLAVECCEPVVDAGDSRVGTPDIRVRQRGSNRVGLFRQCVSFFFNQNYQTHTLASYGSVTHFYPVAPLLWSIKHFWVKLLQ